MENIFSLSLLRGVNYLLPLITLPYLTRTLGVEKFGLVMFAQALVQYFVYLTDYGFYLSATREIALNRDNPEEIGRIFNAVLFSKLSLAILGFAIVLILVSIVPKFNNDIWLYIFSYGMVFGYALFPEWFFQGMEKMKYITILNIIAKLIFTISIFIFIRSADNYIYVPILFSAGFVISGILGILISYRKFNIRFFWPGNDRIRQLFAGGFNIFVTGFSSQLYNNSIIFLLGIFTNNVMVGYFSAASKVVEAINSIIHIISQAFYPYLNRKPENHKRFAIVIIITGAILSGLLFLLAGLIVNSLYGNQYHQSIMIMKILSAGPLMIALIHAYGTGYLLIINQDRLYMQIGIGIAIIGLIMTFIWVPLYKSDGAAISLTITRIMFAGTVLYYGVKLKNKLQQKIGDLQV